MKDAEISLGEEGGGGMGGPPRSGECWGDTPPEEEGDWLPDDGCGDGDTPPKDYPESPQPPAFNGSTSTAGKTTSGISATVRTEEFANLFVTPHLTTESIFSTAVARPVILHLFIRGLLKKFFLMIHSKQ